MAAAVFCRSSDCLVAVTMISSSSPEAPPGAASASATATETGDIATTKAMSVVSDALVSIFRVIASPLLIQCLMAAPSVM